MDEMQETSKWYEDVPYQECKEFINTRLQSMTRDFVAIGYYLKYVRDHKLYLEDLYEDVFEFAQNEFGMRRPTVNHCIRINTEFSVDGNSPVLDDKYADFSRSQLQELLYIPEEKREDVTPDMTVKEIRKQNGKRLDVESKEKSSVEEFSAYGTNVKEPETREPVATDCPPGISSCIRQEWGTDPDQQERGRKECKKCWKDYENIQKALESKNKTEKESVAPAQEELEGKREVLHFTADDKSIDNAYGAMIAELIHNYLDNDYKAPDRECEASVFGQTYKVLKRSEVTVFYTADGETFFDVENARLEREYQYWQQNKAMLEQPSVVEDTAESEECSVIEEYVTITPQDVLHEAQKQLNDWIEAFKDDTEPDFIRKQKIIVAALAGMVCDLEDLPPEPGPQPELPLLKNSDQRKEWLNNYKSWGIWYSDDRIGARYYRYQFKNGAVLIIEEYTAPATEYFEEHDRSYFHLVGGPEPPKGKYGYGKWQRYERYNRDTSSETELIEFLKEVQKK